MNDTDSTIPFALALFAFLSSEKLSQDEAKLLYENLWDLYARTDVPISGDAGSQG